MTKLISTIAFVSMIIPASASQNDHRIFWNCLYYGYTADHCLNLVEHYHNDGTILRGRISPHFRPQIEETPNGTTIFRGR